MKVLSDLEKSLLREKGIDPQERLGGGGSACVYSIGTYKGRDDLCIKYMLDVNRTKVETEFETGRHLYETEPTRFAEYVDWITIEIPDEINPNNHHQGSVIILEKLQNVTMANRSLQTIVKLLYDISACVGFMQIEGLTHRDIKLDNIMFCPRTGTYTLIDFGIAINIRETITEFHCKGTVNNIAPESLADKISPLSDYYCVGMTIREWFIGIEMDSPDTTLLSQKGKTKKDYWLEKKKNLPPLDENAYGCPELIRIANKLTQFDRTCRYQSYRELLYDIREVRRKYGIKLALDNVPRPVYVFAVNENHSIISKKEVASIANKYTANSLAANCVINVIGFKDTVCTRPAGNSDFGNNESELLVPADSRFLRELESHIRTLTPDTQYSKRPDVYVCLIGTTPMKESIILRLLKLIRRDQNTSKAHNSPSVAYRVNFADTGIADVYDSGITHIVPVNSKEELHNCLRMWFRHRKGVA